MRVQKSPPEYAKQADKFLSSLDKKTEQRIKKVLKKFLSGILKKEYDYGFNIGNQSPVQLFK